MARNINHEVFCFTGKGPVSRNEMIDMAYKAGARAYHSLCKQVTILVVSGMWPSNSAKAVKARQRGIKLITVDDFFVMCGYQTASSTTTHTTYGLPQTGHWFTIPKTGHSLLPKAVKPQLESIKHTGTDKSNKYSTRRKIELD